MGRSQILPKEAFRPEGIACLDSSGENQRDADGSAYRRMEKKGVETIQPFNRKSMTRPEIVTRIKEAIEKVAPGARIILYGSEARGNATEDSDIDVLILLNKEKLSFKEKTDITYPLYKIELDTGVSISPMVYTREQWENRPFMTPFYVNVMNEGIVIMDEESHKFHRLSNKQDFTK